MSDIKFGAVAGDRTRVTGVTGGNTYHYTTTYHYMYQNSKKKHDDDQHTLRGDLETSPKASLDRHQPDDIDRQPPHIIDQHPPDCIDRHPWLDEPQGFIVETEPIEERMYMSKASQLSVPKHQRPPIWTE